MKAEEIKKAEEFLKKKRPQDFDDIPKWHIEDMIEFAQQFQLPSVSEEEITENQFCNMMNQFYGEGGVFSGIDNIRQITFHSFDGEELFDFVRHCIKLSRLPHEQKEQFYESEIVTVFKDSKYILNVCLSYRHDFGLLPEDEQKKIMFECKEWMRAITNNWNYRTKDEPVGKTYKLEAEQPQEELNAAISKVDSRKPDGCWNCSEIIGCKIYSSGNKCGNWRCIKNHDVRS